jgi:mono/diheme cytochrome c family protein
LSRFVGAAVAIAAATIAIAAASAALAADDSSFTSTSNPGGADGAAIYGHICQGCHMPEGRGAAGAGHYPKLARNPALVSSQYVALLVLGGRNGMPAFGLSATQTMETRGVRLSDAEIAAVVNYVRTHFGNTYADELTAYEVAALPHTDGAEH